MAVDADRLARQLGLPVVAMQANRRIGMDRLRAALAGATDRGSIAPPSSRGSRPRQSARSLELRATTSAARLWSQQGREEEALTALRELCGRFDEGFDTADLTEARQLVDALP